MQSVGRLPDWPRGRSKWLAVLSTHFREGVTAASATRGLAMAAAAAAITPAGSARGELCCCALRVGGKEADSEEGAA